MISSIKFLYYFFDCFYIWEVVWDKVYWTKMIIVILLNAFNSFKFLCLIKMILKYSRLLKHWKCILLIITFFCLAWLINNKIIKYLLLSYPVHKFIWKNILMIGNINIRNIIILIYWLFTVFQLKKGIDCLFHIVNLHWL